MKKAVLAIWAVLIALFLFVESVLASDIKISKETVKQGEFFEITIDGVFPGDFFIVKFQNRAYRSAPGVSAMSHRVVIPVNVFDTLGEAKIFLESKHEILIPQKITVIKSEFEEADRVEIIKPLSSKELKKYSQDQEVLSEIYSKSTKYPFFVTIDEPFFGYPLEKKAKISSPFGFIRKRKVGAKSEKIEKVSHGGTDLAVNTGEAVLASETGIVRLAKELVNSGNTIVIDHGYNIFSVYMHLSQVFVSGGEVVWRGDTIGLSGSTGRVTGPHLHFGMRVRDTWVDPKYFVKSFKEEK